MRARRARTTQEPASFRPEKTALEHALFKSRDTRKLTEAIDQLRQNGNFKMLELVSKWINQTTQLAVSTTSNHFTSCQFNGKIYDKAGRAINFQSAIPLDKFTPDFKKQTAFTFAILFKLYSLTPFFSCLWNKQFVFFKSKTAGQIGNFIFLNLENKMTFGSEAYHEIGHAIYDDAVRMAAQQNQTAVSLVENWNEIYSIALEKTLYTLVKDSNFPGSNPTYGHPQDTPSELFASSINAFCLHTNAFAKAIQSAKSQDEQRFGRLIWSFLRDELFFGKTFMARDPFKDISWRDELRYFAQDSDIAEMLEIFPGF